MYASLLRDPKLRDKVLTYSSKQGAAIRDKVLTYSSKQGAAIRDKVLSYSSNCLHGLQDPTCPSYMKCGIIT